MLEHLQPGTSNEVPSFAFRSSLAFFKDSNFATTLGGGGMPPVAVELAAASPDLQSIPAA